jgi:hypothetical protein
MAARLPENAVKNASRPDVQRRSGSLLKYTLLLQDTLAEECSLVLLPSHSFLRCSRRTTLFQSSISTSS